MPSACVLTDYGPPNVLEWTDVPMPEPSETQIRIKVRVSGVGPTDLKIRRGDLDAVISPPGAARSSGSRPPGSLTRSAVTSVA